MWSVVFALNKKKKTLFLRKDRYAGWPVTQLSPFQIETWTYISRFSFRVNFHRFMFFFLFNIFPPSCQLFVFQLLIRTGRHHRQEPGGGRCGLCSVFNIQRNMGNGLPWDLEKERSRACVQMGHSRSKGRSFGWAATAFRGKTLLSAFARTKRNTSFIMLQSNTQICIIHVTTTD